MKIQLMKRPKRHTKKCAGQEDGAWQLLHIEEDGITDEACNKSRKGDNHFIVVVLIRCSIKINIQRVGDDECVAGQLPCREKVIKAVFFLLLCVANLNMIIDIDLVKFDAHYGITCNQSLNCCKPRRRRSAVDPFDAFECGTRALAFAGLDQPTRTFKCKTAVRNLAACSFQDLKLTEAR